MSRRVSFTTWGRRARGLSFAQYAVAQDYEAKIEAVVRSIQRTTGLVCCAGPRYDGMTLEKGKRCAIHYQITLGTPCRGGGFTPKAKVWISIPVGGGHVQ